MAITARFGGQSYLWIGRQSANGTFITAGPAAHNSADSTGKMINARFPFTGLGLDLASEKAESASIIGGDASSKRAGGQLWCEGTISTEIIPDQLIHLLYGFFNTSPTEGNSDENAFASSNTASFTKSDRVLTAPSNLSVVTPGKVKVTLSADDTGTMTVVGSRRVGLPSAEVVPMTETVSVTNGDVFETKNYFAGVDTITFSSDIAVANIPGTANNVTLDTDTRKTTISGFDDDLFPGWTMQMSKGGVPVVAYDVVPNTGTLSIDDTIGFEMSCIGSQIWNYRTIAGGTDEKFEVEDEWANNTNYPLPDLDFLPSWGCALKFGGMIQELVSLSMEINLNLESRASYTGSRYRNRARKSATPRQITITPRVFFESGGSGDSFIRWQDVYIRNALTPLELAMYNWLDNGRQYKIVFKFAGAQLIEVPAISIEDSSNIERDLTFLSIPTNTSGNSNELICEVFANDWSE